MIQKPFGNSFIIRKPDFNHGLPVGAKARFKKGLQIKVNRFLAKTGNQIIYVYGGYDAWSSTAVMPSGKTDALKIVNKVVHMLPESGILMRETQKKFTNILRQWLDINN